MARRMNFGYKEWLESYQKDISDISDMGMTRRPRPKKVTVIEKKEKPKYTKNGHIVCPFEGYEELHKKSKKPVRSDWMDYFREIR